MVFNLILYKRFRRKLFFRDCDLAQNTSKVYEAVRNSYSKETSRLWAVFA